MPKAKSMPVSIVHPLTVAYFSMEIGLDPAMPTYAGGLGVLAGDTLRAAADLGIHMVGVTLLHRKGFFRQRLDAKGNQTESPSVWSPEKLLEPLEPQATVTIEGREVNIRAWSYTVHGTSGYNVPVFLLDTALPENSAWDQTLTDNLYGGDDHYRLCQEVVLGLGGAAMLRALGYKRVETYHMNEGHSALLALAVALREYYPPALLEEQHEKKVFDDVIKSALDGVRHRCVFTTHTPVPAGMDKFPEGLVRQVIGDISANALKTLGGFNNSVLNMTYLGLLFSHYINGVSMRHEEVSRSMFPNYPINSITNGVHAATWISEPFQQLYDNHFPEWRNDNLYLRYAISCEPALIREAHVQAKQALLAEIERRTGVRFAPNAMTIGFARRATAYKRADLLFSDIERLKRIARQAGPLQIVYAGKAHLRDEGGKALIRRIFEAAAALRDVIPVVYLEEYDMALAKYLCSGVDLWLNTPLKPEEASGTSGMKAALNGVPSFSVLDGWWVEGHVEGVTGWSVGDSREPESDHSKEIASLYDKLEHVIMPMFYQRPDDYAKVMRTTIALNASFYNAQRMMSQYMKNAYLHTD